MDKPQNSSRAFGLHFSYREAVLCLELVVNINADSVKVLHFRTGLNVPGRSGAQKRGEKKDFNLLDEKQYSCFKNPEPFTVYSILS